MFVTYQKYNQLEDAEELAALLKQHQIDYVIEDSSVQLDGVFSNNELGREYRVKLKKEDFEQAEALMVQLAERYINQVPKDYYMFTFSKEELLEVIARSDEWSKLDYLLALKLLDERRIRYTKEDLEKIKQERILELSAPEQNQGLMVVTGYILSFLGGLGGIWIGWRLNTHKKTLPDGSRAYTYSADDRKHGSTIFILGICALIFWVVMRILISR